MSNTEVTILKLQDSSGDEFEIISAGGVYFFHVGQWERRGFFTATPEQVLEIVRTLLRSLNVQEPYLTSIHQAMAQHGQDWEVVHDIAEGNAVAILEHLGMKEFSDLTQQVPPW